MGEYADYTDEQRAFRPTGVWWRGNVQIMNEELK
jgi:hypothetical protein